MDVKFDLAFLVFARLIMRD